MPPDSKDLSSLKDKSSSYHRLQTADFEGMKGRYLTPEELKGFDKYKVSVSSLIEITWILKVIDRAETFQKFEVIF